VPVGPIAGNADGVIKRQWCRKSDPSHVRSELKRIGNGHVRGYVLGSIGDAPDGLAKVVERDIEVSLAILDLSRQHLLSITTRRMFVGRNARDVENNRLDGKTVVSGGRRYPRISRNLHMHRTIYCQLRNQRRFEKVDHTSLQECVMPKMLV